jgi:cyclic pyranopterin phosphate synthase
VPQLRICATSHCDKHCIYCRPGGEGFPGGRAPDLDAGTLVEVARLLHDEWGVQSVRVTGGEPLLRGDIIELLSGLRRVGVEYLTMVTRSPSLQRYLPGLAGLLDELTVSLDSLDDDRGELLSGLRQTAALKEAIRTARSCGANVRVNMVLVKGANDGELEAMADFCGRHGLSLKLFDLMNMPEDVDFWSKHYMSLEPLRGWLAERCASADVLDQPGILGTRTPRYLMPSGTVVFVKDSHLGAFYGDVCAGCPDYPCQDAIMALRLTHDGKLKRCLIRNDNLVDVAGALRAGTPRDELVGMVEPVMNTYLGAVFHSPGWSATHELQRLKGPRA